MNQEYTYIDSLAGEAQKMNIPPMALHKEFTIGLLFFEKIHGNYMHYTEHQRENMLEYARSNARDYIYFRESLRDIG